MSYPILGVAAGFAVVAAWFATVLVLEAYWRMQAPRVVHCPAGGTDAAVVLDDAAADLPRVMRCSRRPFLHGCTQACLRVWPVEGQPIS